MDLIELSEFKIIPEVSQKLKDFGIVKVFSEGTVILNEHAYVNAIPIVLSGNIKVTQSDEENREILLYYIKPGESCIMSFLAGLHQDQSKIKATVEEETELLLVPIDKVSLLIKEYPTWLDYIFRLYHKRFEELLEVVNAVAFKKMDERLLDFLQTKVTITHQKTLHLTHEQVANELGTARVVISRLLKKLEEDGILLLGRNKITLV
jgi:CRP/FNR family transcriptional regulator